MAESLEAFNEVDQMRRELKGLRGQVAEVDAKVEDLRAAQSGALALNLVGSLSASGMNHRETILLLTSAGMTPVAIAKVLGKTTNAVEMTLKRERAKGKN